MKILIISNNCFSKSQNMGKTLSSIFSAFNNTEICQLYFYSSIPDNTICNNFFRISDYDLIKGKLFGKIGHAFSSKSAINNKLYESEEIQKAYKHFNRNKPSVALARTFIWDIARWCSKELDSWIHIMNPDCIFFASGDTVFSYKIVWRISKKYNLPILSYICDEFYYGYQATGIIGYVYHNILRKWMRKIYDRSVQLVVICEQLGELYNKEFKKDYYLLNTGSEIQTEKIEGEIKSNCISYFGNIGLNRWKSLVQIGKALEKLNNVYATNYKLNIYSGETNKDILDFIKSVNAIKFCGKITPQECVEKMRSSIAVIHTESFEAEDIVRVKYSMSTKIADSLSSGTCLFAYGSLELSSIQYLIKNKCAIVVTAEEDLEAGIYNLLNNMEERVRCIEMALYCASKNHNSIRNSRLFKENIKENVINYK